MSFLTEEQLKYAKRMEDSFNEVIPDGLDQVPNTLILKYGTPTPLLGEFCTLCSYILSMCPNNVISL